MSSLKPGRHPCTLVGALFARDLDAALRPAEVVTCPEASEAERRDRIDRREVACNQKLRTKVPCERDERGGGSGSVGNRQRRLTADIPFTQCERIVLCRHTCAS